MDAKKLKYFKNRLLEERARITASLNHNEDEFEGSTTARSAEFEEASKIDRDREYISGLLTMDTDILAEIDDALKRIREGTYGKCVDTGQDIPEARLEAMPWAARTVAAQEAYELRKDMGEEE